MKVNKFFSGILIAMIVFVGTSAGYAQSLKKIEKVGHESNLYQIVYNPVDNHVYVSAANDFDSKGAVYKLDSETLEVVDSFIVANSAPMGLGINVATQTLYSTNSRTGLVTAIDIESGKQTHISCAIPIRHAREVIVDESRNLIYITHVRAGGMWVIDGETNTFQRFIYNLGGAITGAALDVESNMLYATAMRDDKIIVVDAGTGIVKKRFDAHGQRPTNVYFDGGRNRLYVANQTTANITVLNSETGEFIKAIPTGRGALGVDYDSQKDRIYVANRHGRSMTIIDASSLEIVKNIDIEGLPNTIAINHKTGEFYATNKAAIKEKDADGNEVIREAKFGDSVSKFGY